LNYRPAIRPPLKLYYSKRSRTSHKTRKMNKELLQERFEKHHLQEIIQDLIIRFIICCPEEEHESFDRLFFQIEEAHWFYMDEYRQKNPKLPSLSFKQFAKIIFESCPLLQQYKDLVHEYRSEWVQYKTSVPVCGAIILNQSMDRALLVRGISSSSSWSFPRGKINRDEPTASCAIREVLEETGLDITNLIQETEYLEMTLNEQTIKLYLVVMNVHESEITLTPQTRGEIGAIEWLHLKDDILRGNVAKKKKFFSVIPFVRQLNSWIHNRVVTPTKLSPRQQSSTKSSQKSVKNRKTGKPNTKNIIHDMEYQIPTRSAPRNIGSKKSVSILKRGESLPNVHRIDTVSSSYSPPNILASPSSFSCSESSDSFKNFQFNADDIVGDLTFCV
jgi:mRNA-decapping enzyme subunit 2